MGGASSAGNKIVSAVKKPMQKGGAESEVDKYGTKILGEKTYQDWKNSPLGGKYAKILTDTVVGKKKGSSGSSVPVGPDGKPIVAPTYQSISKGGVLGDNYRLGDANPWLKMQNEKQGIEQKYQMNNAIQNQLSSQGAAESALAMRGGLSSGSRERLARSGMRDLNLQKQGVYTQGNINRLGLESDAFDKNQAAQQFNIQTLLKDKEMAEQSQQSKYQQDMTAWAAGKQADATRKSGKK